jgi:adenylate kinase family enzyme
MVDSMSEDHARRIVVYGVTGSGKSTTAQTISHATGVPCYSVDDLTWAPNWVEVPREEQRRRIESVCAREEWILDGAYSKWIDIVFARADLIVALDFPRWLSLGRLFRRTLTRVISKQLVCNGNQESVWLMCSRDSILVWHFRSFRRKRQRMRQWSMHSPGPAVYRFEHPKDLQAWCATLRPADLR